MKGFGLFLTDNERKILDSFCSDNTLVWPAVPGISDKEAGHILRQLADKNYIQKKEGEPYKLTKLGIRAVKGTDSVSKRRQRSSKPSTQSGSVYVTTARIDTTSGAIPK